MTADVSRVGRAVWLHDVAALAHLRALVDPRPTNAAHAAKCFDRFRAAAVALTDDESREFARRVGAARGDLHTTGEAR